jgi:hypothetical protein
MLFGVGIPLVFIPITAAAYDGVPGMMTPARARYSGYGFPAEITGHAVWLYFRFPLGLRMVEELFAARGIIVSHETVRQWVPGFRTREARSRDRKTAPLSGDWQANSPRRQPVATQRTARIPPAR